MSMPISISPPIECKCTFLPEAAREIGRSVRPQVSVVRKGFLPVWAELDPVRKGFVNWHYETVIIGILTESARLAMEQFHEMIGDAVMGGGIINRKPEPFGLRGPEYVRPIMKPLGDIS